MKKAINIQQLTVSYEKTTVLWDISLSIGVGDFVGIIGPNGAGKSTLIKAALNLVRPLSGTISFFGKPFSKMHKKVAYVPQKESVDWDFPTTVFDVALMGRFGSLGFLKWAKKADREACAKALERLGLLALADKQISELSGGQQQRLFIVRALLQDADIYLLDEPFAGVDHVSEKLIVGILKKMQENGKTILMVHHDLNSVENYFDHVAMLNTSLIAFGPIDEVFHAKNLTMTFGKRGAFFDHATKLSKEKAAGIS